MGKELLHPQEIEVLYILPTLRKYLSSYMAEKGLKQKKIAELLHIQEATVSQYLHDKRGNKVIFEEPLLTEIKKSATRIKDRTTLLQETQQLLAIIRNTGVLCSVHRQFSTVPKDCDPHIIGCAGGNYARLSN